jgi:predicted HD phosphohydrolase
MASTSRRRFCISSAGCAGRSSGSRSTATSTRCRQPRALRDGADEETVVCALLHDIGDIIAPENHCDIAAGILKPYVSEENHWLVKHHVIFSGYYFFQFCGLDRNARNRRRPGST